MPTSSTFHSRPMPDPAARRTPPPRSPREVRERVNWIVMLFRRGILTVRMALAAIVGRAHVSLGTFLAVVFSAVYFVSPVDLIPDVLPILGWIDDGLVLAWLWSALEEDLSRFAVSRGLDPNRYRLPPPPPEPAE